MVLSIPRRGSGCPGAEHISGWARRTDLKRSPPWLQKSPLLLCFAEGAARGWVPWCQGRHLRRASGAGVWGLGLVCCVLSCVVGQEVPGIFINSSAQGLALEELEHPALCAEQTRWPRTLR